MKPPPRKRTKRDRNLKPETGTHCKLVCKWQRAEQRKLLNGLRTLSKHVRGQGDIDYAYLRKHLPTRSTTEIQSVVELLKNKVISSVSIKLQSKRREEKKIRKPIEVWTHMASAVAGTLEEHISTAFSQMLIMSSSEPRTLRNCDPPQVHRPSSEQNGPVGRTVPLRPIPRLPVQGEPPGTNTASPLPILKTPAPTMGSGKALPAPPQVVRVPNNTTPPPKQQSSKAAGNSLGASTTSSSASSAAGEVRFAAVVQTTPQPPQHHTTTICSATASTSATPLLSISDTSPNSLPGAACSSAASSCSVDPAPTRSTHLLHTKFGQSRKYTMEDNPRTLGVKSVVDFERIYQYLTAIHKPSDECKLTPMESAIVLDLLMSLPEELCLLDCKNLYKHLIQVYQCLSAPADSKMARKLFKDLKAQRQGAGEPERHTMGSQDMQTEAQSIQNPEANPQQDNHSCDSRDTEAKALEPQEADSQSSRSNKTGSQSGHDDMTVLCPPLNPFMVPLELLMRRSSSK